MEHEETRILICFKGRLDARGEDCGVKIYIDSFSKENDTSLKIIFCVCCVGKLRWEKLIEWVVSQRGTRKDMRTQVSKMPLPPLKFEYSERTSNQVFYVYLKFDPMNLAD